MSHARLYEVSSGYVKIAYGVLSHFDGIFTNALKEDERALVEYAGIIKYALLALKKLELGVRAGDHLSLISIIPQLAFVEGEIKRLKFALVISGTDY